MFFKTKSLWALAFICLSAFGTYTVHQVTKEDPQLTEVKEKVAEQAEELRQKEERLNVLLAESSAQKQQLLEKQGQIDSLKQDVIAKQGEIDHLNLALKLMTVEHRVASVTVLDQKRDMLTGRMVTEIEFVETDTDGEPIGEARRMSIPGNRVFLAYLVVEFKDGYVQKGDVFRGTSICFLESIYGNEQKPNDGYTLDKTGTRPLIYGQGRSPLSNEDELWRDFWDIAHDKERAEELGIRTMHGSAPYAQMRKGYRYIIKTRAAGKPEVMPEEIPLETMQG